MVMYAETNSYQGSSSDDSGGGSIPPLPPIVKKNEDEELARKASPTLDAMIAYIKKWATRSYDLYWEGAAVWALSTINARRSVLPWRAGFWANLYLMFASETTRTSKTEAALYAIEIIKACGLGFLLCPDEITPERLMSKMSGRITIPRNYSCMNEDAREFFRRGMAFSAQKGWLYDEFGDILNEIMNSRGGNKFYRLLKKLYDSKQTFTYDTVTRGEEQIAMPYLSLLGTIQPSLLKSIASPANPIWTDGTFARVGWIVPPRGFIRVASAPDGVADVPFEIKDTLKKWHQRLGEPECFITETEADGKKGGTQYEITRGDLPQRPVYWSDSSVREAHQAYYHALVMLAQEHNLDERFLSGYGRLPDMALKIAMLLASLESDGHENGDRMAMRHWARGQQIAEHWRAGFHELIAQLGSEPSERDYGAHEQAVIEVVEKYFQVGQKFTRRDVVTHGNSTVRTLGSPGVGKILDELAGTEAILRQGKLHKDGTGRSARFWVAPPEPPKEEPCFEAE